MFVPMLYTGQLSWLSSCVRVWVFGNFLPEVLKRGHHSAHEFRAHTAVRWKLYVRESEDSELLDACDGGFPFDAGFAIHALLSVFANRKKLLQPDLDPHATFEDEGLQRVIEAETLGEYLSRRWACGVVAA